MINFHIFRVLSIIRLSRTFAMSNKLLCPLKVRDSGCRLYSFYIQLNSRKFKLAKCQMPNKDVWRTPNHGSNMGEKKLNKLEKHQLSAIKRRPYLLAQKAAIVRWAIPC